MTEIIFEVTEAPEGGFDARALGHSIFTQGEDWDDLKAMARDAVLCHFGEEGAPLAIGCEEPMSETEIIFQVSEDEVDGGYTASALGYGIHTEGDSLEELRGNVREAVDCYFDDTMPRPKRIRLHFVR